MMYENEKTCGVGPGGVPQAPVENLTDILNGTSSVAIDLLSVSRRIKNHMFGEENTPCSAEKGQAAPGCVRDQLAQTRRDLMMVQEELLKICAMLGV